MNASEKIVNAWLHSKGYFTMTNILLSGRQEIDILAVKPGGNKVKREHYEVHVSIRPRGPIRVKSNMKYADEPFGKRIKEFIEHSFIGKDGKKRDEVIKRFGSNDYEMVHVRSRRIDKRDTSPEHIKEEFEIHHVKLVWFEDILKELISHMKEQDFIYPEETWSLVQLFNEFGQQQPNS